MHRCVCCVWNDYVTIGINLTRLKEIKVCIGVCCVWNDYVTIGIDLTRLKEIKVCIGVCCV